MTWPAISARPSEALTEAMDPMQFLWWDRYCHLYSPLHRMPFNSRHEGSKRVPMTWRAHIARHVTGCHQTQERNEGSGRVSVMWRATCSCPYSADERGVLPDNGRGLAGRRQLPWRAPGEAQGLTLVHFSAQPKPFLSHRPVSPCVIDWGKSCTRRIPQNVLMLSRKVDECKPSARPRTS
jgi:hypothetical protein